MPARRLRIGLGFLLGAVCLWIAFRHVSWPELAESLRAANYWWLLVYPVLATLLNIVRAEIWRALLKGRAGAVEAFWAYSVGFLANNVLPLRLGEAARVAMLSLRCDIPVVEVAAAAGLERVLDLIAVLTILVGILPFIAPTPDVQRAIVWTALSASTAVALLVAMIAGRRHVDRLVEHVALLAGTRRALVIARWHELSRALAIIANPRVAAGVISGAAAVWTMTVVLQWTVLRAFQPAARMLDAAVMIGVVSIAAAVPGAPGAIGTYQWVGQQALVGPFPMRYSAASALAIALVSHLCSYVFSSGLGAVGLWYFGVPLRELSQKLSQTFRADAASAGGEVAPGYNPLADTSRPAHGSDARR
jgi:uncharacterized protein (TIRG00374 family)